jgi:phospholipid/cholesterol/gamma-HCH transport system substrate-binding protein
MRNTLETRLGLFFALAFMAAFLVLEMVGSFDFLTPGVRVRARFDNVKELMEGDPVKMGGKSIGRVESIVLTNQLVEVTMKLTAPEAVRTDSRVRVQFAGLMGQNYVDVSFGSGGAPVVTPGSILESVSQPDLSTLMAKLENVATGVENLTQSFSGDQIQNLLGPMTDFIRENSSRMGDILENTKVVTKRIADGEGTVGRLINEDTLYVETVNTMTNFNAAAADVRLALDDARAALADARVVLNGVREGEGTLGRLATDETLYEEATAAVVNLREILVKINQGQGTVGKIVNDETLYKNVRLSLQKLDKATESLEDQGPLSAIGIAIGTLF